MSVRESDSSDPREDEFWPQLQREASLEQITRLTRGNYVVPVLLLILWFTTPFPHDHPSYYWFGVTLVSGSLIIRFFLARKKQQIYAHIPKWFQPALFAAVAMTSIVSGLLYCATIVYYGFENWTFTVVMFWIVGVSSGGTITFTPTLSLMRLFVLLLLGPAAVAGFFKGSTQGNMFAVGTVILTLFLLGQGKRLSETYWEELRNRAREKVRNRELEAAKQAAEAASRAKSQFLANMSHELRTPMHGILGMTQIARDSRNLEEVRGYLQSVNTSAEVLLHVLNDILDFSKIEAGKMTMELVPFPLQRVVSEAYEVVRGQAKRKGLHTECVVASEIPEVLVGDPVRLRQVVVNLLGNAVKFTERGSVKLAVELLSRSGNYAEVLFRVSDTGIGIPASQQESIFAAFAQADGSVTRRFGGTGLGLSICQELVQMMGGKICVESTVGAGSTFSFTAMLEAGQMDEIPQKPVRTVTVQRKLRILLAEDNLINQRVATTLLRKCGHEVQVVSTGTDAVEFARSEDFDVILMDNQMPGMGGMEAAGEIRRAEAASGRKRTPIVALTASAMRGDRERFLQAGMDTYLAKPFAAEELYAVIEDASSVAG